MRSLIDANLAALTELQGLVNCFTADQYASISIEGVSAPGKHVRHITDHYDAFFCGLRSGTIDYDQRSRASIQETCQRHSALTITRIQQQIRISARDDSSLKLVTTVSDNAAHPHRLTSSVHRELIYLLNHTIHHTAMLSLLARLHGVCNVPAGGVAPSTRRWEKNQSRCSASASVSAAPRQNASQASFS